MSTGEPSKEALETAVEKFRYDLIDGLVVRESDGEPWPLTKSEANQIAEELQKLLAPLWDLHAAKARVEAQQEMRDMGFQHPKDVEAMILAAAAKARLEEAKWWNYLAFPESDNENANRRIAALARKG